MHDLNLQKLRLRDFRCFESIEIDFHPQLTLLVAGNGGGKTAILDAIAVAFGPYVGAFDESVGRHFDVNDIRKVHARETASNEMEYAARGTWLEAWGRIPGSIADAAGRPSAVWSRALAGPGKKTTIRDAKELIEYGKDQQEAVRTPGKNIELALLAYYGTGRLWQQKKRIEGRLARTSRTIGYTDCLDPASSYKSFVEWFRYWSNSAKSGRIESLEAGRAYTRTEFDDYIESVGDAVNRCLAPSGWKDVSYSLTREALEAHHDRHGRLPVEQLSDGIRNMIGMVADIAFRATKLNPQLGSRASQETSGLVLIDEVDMHLHPEWQQVVLSGLVSAFPNVQFIVTTHSPQVLSTVRRENIRILRETETGHEAVMPDFSPLAQEAGDALARVMGTSVHAPLPVLETVQRYEQKVRAGLEASDEAGDLKRTLDAAGYQLQDSDLAMWRLLARRKVQG